MGDGLKRGGNMLKFKKESFHGRGGRICRSCNGTESAEMVSGGKPMDTQTAGQEGADDA